VHETRGLGQGSDGSHGTDTSLASRSASGVGWLAAQTWVAKAGGFLTLVVLARLLTPSDFGLVAIATTVLPLIYLLADLGFGTYLMQAKTLDRVTTSTAFWYSSGSGLVLSGVLAAAAPGLETFFGVDGVAAVLWGMTPAILLVTLSAVPVAILRRGMRFRALALQSAVAAITAQLVAIALAFSGAGVWALVAQTIVAQAIILGGALISARWRPALSFRPALFATMTRFGTQVVGVNVVALARQWGENALITNVLGAAALGRLNVAQRLVQTTQEIASSAIAPVSTVVFAQVRDDPERLRRGYLRALGLAYFTITPALTAIVVLAPLLVPLVFGPQWNQSALAAQALALAALFTLGAILDHGLYYGMGRPGAWLVYATVIDALTVAATAIAVWSGIAAVAFGFAIVSAIATVSRWVLVSRAVGASFWRVARPLGSALLLAAVSGAAGWATAWILRDAPAAVAVLAAGVVILVVHVALGRVLMPAAAAETLAQISTRGRPLLARLTSRRRIGGHV
jgi:O-antigen/teichoic acid export membrane protein